MIRTVQYWRRRPPVCVAALWAIAIACGESRGQSDVARSGGRVKGNVSTRVTRAGKTAPDIPAITTGNAVQSLALAAGRDPRAYREVSDTAALAAGTVIGTVVITSRVPTETAIEPTHDRGVCAAFTQAQVPSVDGGVGNAIVWLVGVTHGPPQRAPLRAALTLERCRLEPRVQRAAVGGTLQLTSRDAMTSRLRFHDVGDDAAVRVIVPFTDAGQVVPTSAASQTPGLIEVRDDLHPWVRAYVAIAPHPFVAVTLPTGSFAFEGVPAGTYTLVVWQERLGIRFEPVRVTRGVETRVRIGF